MGGSDPQQTQCSQRAHALSSVYARAQHSLLDSPAHFCTLFLYVYFSLARFEVLRPSAHGAGEGARVCPHLASHAGAVDAQVRATVTYERAHFQCAWGRDYDSGGDSELGMGLTSCVRVVRRENPPTHSPNSTSGPPAGPPATACTMMRWSGTPRWCSWPAMWWLRRRRLADFGRLRQPGGRRRRSSGRWTALEHCCWRRRRSVRGNSGGRGFSSPQRRFLFRLPSRHPAQA